MKKTYQRYLIFAVVIISLPIFAFITDYTLAAYDKRPLFVIPTEYYKDGGTIEYSGIGYKVIKYNDLNGRKDAVFISRLTGEK